MSEPKLCSYCKSVPQANTWTLHGISETRYFCPNPECPHSVRTVTLEEWQTRPIEDELTSRITNLEGANRGLGANYIYELNENIKLNARIAELEQAVGLITTLKPTMVMDADHPLEMAKEVAEYVNTRIAELEGAQCWTPVSEGLPELDQDVFAVVDGELDRGHFYQQWDGEVFFSSDEKGAMMVATHWMPLPELPEVQE